MKKLSINNLLVFVVAVILAQNDCVMGACPADDIKFELYKDHYVSLPEKFIELVDKPQAGDEIMDTLFNEIANTVPAGGAIATGIKDHFGNDADYEKQKESEREKAVAIIKDIVQHIQKYKQFEIGVEFNLNMLWKNPLQ